MSINLHNALENQSVDLVLEDLLVRFVVNVPAEDLSSIERVFFQVEEAQWFYTDFVRALNLQLPGMKMKNFAPKILEKCPLIWKWGDPSDAISRFGKYKSTIPVRGVALFNKSLTKVLLVKGTESNAWSFPRGKISKDETDLQCALREAEEEIGFDATNYVNENDVIERTIKGKSYKIYLAKNTPEDFDYQPKARHEISEIKWHDIKTIQKKIKHNPNNYFVVSAIMKPMMKWINKNKGVLTEEEIMLDAERKLKALLGISKPKEKNNDAGREILNILQGAVPQNSVQAPNAPPQYIQMTLPQHVQIPQFYNPGFFGPNFNIYGPPLNGAGPTQAPVHAPPQGSASAPGLPPAPAAYGQSPVQPMPQRDALQPLNITQQPHPQTLQRPTINKTSNDMNSKEILSILNRNNINSLPHLQSDSNSTSIASNRSKAQSLLELFGKKPPKKERKEETEKPEANSEVKSDGLERKVNQKARVKAEKAPRGVSPYGESHQPSNEIEKSMTSSKENLFEPGKKVTLLKKSQEKPESSASSKTASSLLMALLGKPAEKPTEDVESFDDFGNSQDNDQDFEDFEAFEEFEPSTDELHTRNKFRNFDVDSDDDEKYSTPITHTPNNNSYAQSFDDGQKRTKSEEPIADSKAKGNYLLGLLNGKKHSPEPKEKPEKKVPQHTNKAATSLLNLLVSKNAPQAEEKAPEEETTDRHSSARDLLSVLKG